MKIIRSRCRPQRPQVATAAPVTEIVKPKRKALLIGINYETTKPDDSPESDTLRGPHRNVIEMKALLMDHYGYESSDIVLMMDKRDAGHIHPTRANILKEIGKLIVDAQSGDRFFFHYSGHSTQLVNKNNSEEDGMDECLIPIDRESGVITDNELRRHLVDKLPVGSNLVAIFDSCHSASMLDLHHIWCNRVYVPWISKGKRKSDSLLNGNVRRQAIVVTRRVYQNRRVSSKKVRSRRTSIDQLSQLPMNYQRLSVKTKSLSLKSDLDKWYDTPSSPIQRCDSPASMWPCTGYCPPSTSEKEEADVISLAACTDDQRSWEDDDGSSMTTALISVLKNNPHPTLRNLMTTISHHLHKLHLRMHGTTRAYKKDLKKYQAEAGSAPPKAASEGYVLEMDNFQDPQLASHRPLDMDTPWSL